MRAHCLLALTALVLTISALAEETKKESDTRVEIGFGGYKTNQGDGSHTHFSVATPEARVTTGYSTLHPGGAKQPIHMGTLGAHVDIGSKDKPVVLGDPLLFYSNGTYRQIGASPVLGMGAGYVSRSSSLVATPKIVAITDQTKNETMYGFGAQLSYDVLLAKRLGLNALGQVSFVQDGDGKTGRFYLVSADATLKLLPFAAIYGGVEAADLHTTKTVDGETVKQNSLSFTAKGGIKAIF